ncbi:hypothetical protein ILYODFUR_001776 [Ilyodon furcidens]|uniref:Uncharacterized protein n=1 Tax=Ilyodon furcidens TaxID=33524 RepID=A0ABV0TFH3_9TELE
MMENFKRPDSQTACGKNPEAILPGRVWGMVLVAHHQRSVNQQLASSICPTLNRNKRYTGHLDDGTSQANRRAIKSF